jgi:MoaA/NifB/PqqE/SkfB family radical SAM enzyme
VTFTGGEPTMREDLTELVTYAKRFVTRVNTNGILLTPELATRLREAGLDSVQVTLYSHDAKIHNLLVGAEHFSDTVTGIKAAVSAGLDVSVNTPLCGANADYVKTLEFIYSLGVRFVTVSGLIATGKLEGRADRYDLSHCVLEEILRDAKAYCDGVGMEIDFTSPGLVGREVLESLGMKVPACGACLSNMAIAPNGDAVPCQSWLGEDATLGNLLTDDFKDIWSSPLCHKLRSMTEDEAEGCPLRRRGGSGNG